MPSAASCPRLNRERLALFSIHRVLAAEPQALDLAETEAATAHRQFFEDHADAFRTN